MTCKTRENWTLAHCHAPFGDAFKALPHARFSKSDHCSILLLPTYRDSNRKLQPFEWFTSGLTNRTPFSKTVFIMSTRGCSAMPLETTWMNTLTQSADSSKSALRTLYQPETLRSTQSRNHESIARSKQCSIHAAQHTSQGTQNSTKHTSYNLHKTVLAAKCEYQDRVLQQFDMEHVNTWNM